MEKTIEDLKKMRDRLVYRRRRGVYDVGNPHDPDPIEKVVQAHLAIQAIDAVIAEGEDQPDVVAAG